MSTSTELDRRSEQSVEGAPSKAKAAVVRPLNDQVFKKDGALREDRLGRNELAQQIAGIIGAVEPPFTAAVYGSWGEGKTHLLHNVKQRVDADDDFYTVWFDLWEHQFDVNPVVAMLQTAQEVRRSSGAMNWNEIAHRVKEVTAALLWTAADVLTPSVVFSGLDPAAELKLDGNAISQAWQRNRHDQLQARMRVQEDQVKLQALFKDALDSLAGGRKIVFFIDDLDRCLPERIVDLLEKIKLYMCHPKCVFMLAIDPQAVVQAIDQVKEYKNLGIAEHYLEKMVQVAFDLPLVASGKKETFIRKMLCDAANRFPDIPTLTDEEIEVIVPMWRAAFEDSEVDATTRLMIRTINTFVIDHAVAMGQSAPIQHETPVKYDFPNRLEGYDPRVAAVLAAMKTCYRDVYAGLRSNHDKRAERLAYLLNGPQKDPDDPTKVDLRRDDIDGIFGGRGDGFLQEVRRVGLNVSGQAAETHFKLAGSSGAAPLVDSAESFSSRIPRSSGSALDLVEFEERTPSSAENVAEQQRLIRYGAKSVSLSGYEWRVLVGPEEGHGRALLLSDRIVGKGPYNREQVDVTWETCDLRRWLNGQFMASLGRPMWEQVEEGPVENPDNPFFGTPGGRATSDRAFLLSLEEMMRYLAGQQKPNWGTIGRQDFRSGQLIALTEDNNKSWWWLRSPGRNPGGASFVFAVGLVLVDASTHVSSASGGVRPALWLNV
ncbi:MAG: KAP family NTPase [Propionibacteriaceae bacterium]|nr:KAP family NTPase [Propionibacteriaceae bacterium]